MKQLILTILTTLILWATSVNLVIAVDAVPPSGSFFVGATTTINLTANPNGTGQNVVVIRIQANNLTITNYVPPSTGWTVVNPDCTGSVSFTATEICITLGKTTDITVGEDLGTISVTMGTIGTATLTKTTGNVYSDGTTDTPDEGEIGNYTITAAPTFTPTPTGSATPTPSPTPTNSPTPTGSILPATAGGYEDSGFIRIVVGGTMVMLGVLIYKRKQALSHS